VERAAGELGGLDVVVANAGIVGPRASLRSLKAGELERVLDVNLLGEWNAVRPALPHVVRARGHVLVVASLYAAANGMLVAPYAISKAGVEQLGRALRAELGIHGASAGVAYFGFIDTPMVRGAFEDAVTARAREALPAWVTRPIPVGRAGAAIVRGIERRSARVTAPRWIPALLALRGPLAVVVDARLPHDSRAHDSIRALEARREA
jgi:NAD(P)-dependent dehydrogenase (short-subunit alcohol dehydrogenase family)